MQIEERPTTELLHSCKRRLEESGRTEDACTAVQEAQMMDEIEEVFKNFLVSHIYTSNVNAAAKMLHTLSR